MLVVHIDNALVSNSSITQDFFRHNPLKSLQYPSYFPDISPPDFYLFGKVKSALIGGNGGGERERSPMKSTFLKLSRHLLFWHVLSLVFLVHFGLSEKAGESFRLFHCNEW
jgi:hypothetical protein